MALTDEQLNEIIQRRGLDKTFQTTTEPASLTGASLVESLRKAPAEDKVSEQTRTLEPLGFFEKRNIAARQSLQRLGKKAEKFSKTFLPKSVEGFAETLGGALATKTKDIRDAFKGQEELADITLRAVQKIKEAEAQGKDTTRLREIVERNLEDTGIDIGEIIPATKKTTKEIAGEALGTLGTLALGAAPGGGAAGRLAFGAAVGAGAGVKSGLDENAQAEQIIKKGIKGSLIGLATGAIFEGAGRLLSKFAQARPTKEFVGRGFVKAFQPKTKDLSEELKKQLTFGWKTTGERIAEATDDLGKPVFKAATLKGFGKQAVKQISKKSSELDDLLKQFPRARVSKAEISIGIIDDLEDTFGVLTDTQRKTIERELGKIVTKRGGLTLRDALKFKRIVDQGIPDGFWIEPNAQKSFLGHTKYFIRQNLRKLIEQKAGTEQVRKINQELGLALDVQDLVGLRRATAQKVGIPGGFKSILDKTIFTPKLITQSQKLLKLGTKIGETPIRRATRTGLIEKLAE